MITTTRPPSVAPRPTNRRTGAPTSCLLLVDPERRVNFTSAHQPGRIGLYAVRAELLEQAVEEAVRRAPEAILLAGSGTGFDRRAFLRLLRSLPVTREIPVVLVADEDDADADAAAGFDQVRAVISEQATPDRLIATLRAVIHRSTGPDPD